MTPTLTPVPTLAGDLVGQVRYQGSGVLVPDVTMTLDGPCSSSAITGLDGQFAFSALSTSTWQLSASNTAGENGSISAIDASAILRIVVNLDQGTAEQQLAGDVNGSGTLTSLDAALLLQYRVGLIPNLPVADVCGSKWIFVPKVLQTPAHRPVQPIVSSADCQPGRIMYEPLSGQQTAQDFVAVLFGDVNQSWRP